MRGGGSEEAMMPSRQPYLGCDWSCPSLADRSRLSRHPTLLSKVITIQIHKVGRFNGGQKGIALSTT